MNKRADLNAIIRYDGELHEVIAISDGRALVLEPIGKDPCPTCGRSGRVHVLEHSRLFQEKAEPVPTLEAR